MEGKRAKEKIDGLAGIFRKMDNCESRKILLLEEELAKKRLLRPKLRPLDKSPGTIALAHSRISTWTESEMSEVLSRLKDTSNDIGISMDVRSLFCISLLVSDHKQKIVSRAVCFS